MAILDTTFLVAFERREPSAMRRSEALRDGASPLRVPAAVWIEYLASFSHAKRPAAARTLESSVLFEPLTRDIADGAARLQQELFTSGVRLPWHDLQVAATALHFNEPVVSNDAVFRRVPGVEVLGH